MATPAFGPHPDDMAVRDWLDSTFGALFNDDQEELDKIPPLVNSFRKHVKVFDVGGLKELSPKGWKVALARALPAAEVAGTLNILLKYLGVKGHPHVPPGTLIRASAALPFLG